MKLLLLAMLVQDVPGLLNDLSSDDVDVREAARAKLVSSGEAALPALRDARAKTKDPDLLGQLDQIIGAVELAHPGPLKIAYTRGEGRDGEIYLWADGTETRITENKQMESRLALSPDGNRLIYTVAGGKDTSDWDAYEIVLVDLESKREEKLGGGIWAAWSPDGTSIAAACPKGLVAISIEGRRRREVATNLPDKVYKVTWSADGKTLATELDDDIVLFDAESGRREATVSGKPPRTGGLYSFSWAADGKTFSMVSGNGPYSWDVYLTSVEGEPRKLTPEAFRHGITTISPDGARIAFCRSDGDATSFNLIDVASGTVTELHDSANPLLAPSWSPDGKFVVFVTRQGEIRLAHAGTRASRAIAEMKPLYGPSETSYAPSVWFGKR